MKRLLTNVAAVGLADAGVRLIGFLTTAYLGRVLGSEGFGLLGIGLAIAGYLFLIASPGIHVTGTRDIAAKAGEPEEIVTTVVSYRLLAAAVLIALATVVLLPWRGGWPAAATIMVASTAILPMAFSFDWYFQGKEQFFLLSTQKIVGAVAFLAAAVLLVQAPGEAAVAAGAFAIGTAGASVFSYLAYRRQSAFHFAWDPPGWWKMIQGSFPLALSSLLGLTSTAFPVLVAGAMLSTHDAGLMNAATKLVLLALIMDRVFATLFLPALSRPASGSDRARLVRLGLRIMLLLALPVAVAGWVLAPWLMALVFGKGFEAAVSPFRILLVYLTATLVNSAFVAALIVARRERIYFNIMLIGSLVTAATAITMTPVAGLEGTAAAVSLGEVVMMVVFGFVLRSGGVLESAREFVPLVVAGLGMAVVTGTLSGHSLSLGVAGGLAVYAIILAAMRAFNAEDARMLQEVAG